MTDCSCDSTCCHACLKCSRYHCECPPNSMPPCEDYPSAAPPIVKKPRLCSSSSQQPCLFPSFLQQDEISSAQCHLFHSAVERRSSLGDHPHEMSSALQSSSGQDPSQGNKQPVLDSVYQFPKSFAQRNPDNTLTAVASLLDLDSDTVAALRNEKGWNSSPDHLSSKSIQLMTDVILKVSELIRPSNPNILARCFTSADKAAAVVSTASKDMLMLNLIDAIKATRRGTRERRIIRSALCGALTLAEVNTLLGCANENFDQERLVLEDEELEDSDKTRGITKESHCKKTCSLPRMSRKTYSRSRQDWQTLLEFGELQELRFGRARVEDEGIRQLLGVLFSPGNVILMSWTSRKIVFHGKTLNLPALALSKSVDTVHTEYRETLIKKHEKPLSRGSFYAIAKTLTRHNNPYENHTTNDSVVETLINDPLLLLRDVVFRNFPCQESSLLFEKLKKLEWFLLHSFAASHVGTDTDGFHDSSFALGSEKLMCSVSDMSDRAVTCKGCLYPFALLAEIGIHSSVQDNLSDMSTLSSCRDKIFHFLGLLTRRNAQQKGVEEEIQRVISLGLRNRVIIFMSHLSNDNALESEEGPSLYFEDDTVLYGAVVASIEPQNTEPPGEKEIKYPQMGTRFYAHVVTNCSTNTPRVASIAMKALLTRIKYDSAEAKEVIFVSDNSSVYNNGFVPAFVPFLTSSLNLRAVRYIFTCSQICQNLIQAHFASMMTAERGHFSENHPVNVKHFVEALYNEQENLNIAVHIICLNEEVIMPVNMGQIPVPTPMQFEGKNDIEYQYNWTSQHVLSEGCKHVIAKLYDFSGIGVPTTYVLQESCVRAFAREMGYIRLEENLGNHQASTWIDALTGDALCTDGRRRQLSYYRKKLVGTGVSENFVMDLISRLQHKPKENTGGEILDRFGVMASTDGRTVTASKRCTECRREFKLKDSMEKHICTGSASEKDICSRAAVVADEMLSRGILPIFADASAQLNSSSLSLSKVKKKGWASLEFRWARLEIPKDCEASVQGNKHRKEVFELLASGQGLAADPGAIRISLGKKCNNRSDIPTEKTIRSWCMLYEAANRIQGHTQRALSEAPIVPGSFQASDSVSKHMHMSKEYIREITALHEYYLAIPEPRRPKRRHIYNEFKKLFQDRQGRLPSDFPSQKQVLNKLSALRARSNQIGPQQ